MKDVVNNEDLKGFTVKYDRLVDSLQTKITLSPSFKTSDSIKITCFALWDTGATVSAISSEIVRKFKLIPVSKSCVYTAGGIVEQKIYMIDFLLPNEVIVPNVMVSEIDNIYGADVLVGMDIIKHGNFMIKNIDGATILSFETSSSIDG